MINIDKAFNTENRSIYEYFVQPGLAFYIPLYQREYSWDKSNIYQLLEDISKGIEDLTLENSDNKIRFLGTIITVTESDKNKIQPQDTKALPTSIEKVIDGQQRLSTITLISVLLFKSICDLEEILIKTLKRFETDHDKDEVISEINESSNAWKEKLQTIFGVDLMGAVPRLKPKIIRGNVDKWVRKEDKNTSYNSPIAYHLYSFIEFFFNNGKEPVIDKKTNAGENIRIIQAWLQDHVADAQLGNSDFCDARAILRRIKQDDLWQYPRPNLIDLINREDFVKKGTFCYHLGSLIQTFAVCHFLLQRCCFTIIKPANDDWAFDMFQSLNATGTPLTAIETFKPVVVQSVIDYKESIENIYFSKIDKAFENRPSAAQKNKQTNDLLTSFALPIEGKKLATHFSAQKKWLDETYNGLSDASEKQNFIKFFGNYTEFYDEVWNKYKGKDSTPLAILGDSSERDLTSLLLLFLKESNHKMAITFLGTFYSNLVEGEENSVSKFIAIVKAISAFYLIWRAQQSNSGLDDAYRTFFRGSVKLNVQSHTWLSNDPFDVVDIKAYLRNILPNDKETWLEKASQYCSYNTSFSVSKFALINAAHDTMPDDINPGLFKKSTIGKADYLRLEKWISEELNSLEHIAPQSNKGDWSATLYDDHELYNNLGNLTLLPKGVNTSASNKGWKEKLIYYRHLGEQDPDRLVELTNKAKTDGISLKDSNIEILKKAKYADHILPILSYPNDKIWDAEIVRARSRKILDALWDTVIGWLE